MNKISVISLVLPLITASVFAFPSDTWRHLQSDHFVVSYNTNTEPFAREALGIAETTRATLTEYLDDPADPRRLSIVLFDNSDDSNGGASTTDPVVYIDCRKTQSLFRGETDWLRTVLTHELSHLYSLNRLKSPFLLNVVQRTSSSIENFTVSYQNSPRPVVFPKWFVEGIAQMGSRRVGADAHDAIRQMILRDAYLTGKLLSLEEMGRFEGTSRDAELAYNQGFSLLLYLETAYPTPIRLLCQKIRLWGFQAAFVSTYGRPLAELYSEWVSTLADRFPARERAKGARLFAKRGPMVMETASTGDGGFVVANWDNDYTRFGLFRTGPGGNSDVWARDTGMDLKSDFDGSVWFTKLAYNPMTGTETYELFQAGASGTLRQATSNGRVLAFDISEGNLVYARYQGGGRTDLILRQQDGSESLLGTAPAGSAPYALSVVSPQTSLVSLGTGPRVTAAILAQGRWKQLWPGAEVMDVVVAGQDRVVFSSTLDGSPQLYWADLAEGPQTWYRITDAQGGARFPSRDARTGALTYSEYLEGGWYRCALESPLTTTNPVVVPGPLFGDFAALPLPESGQTYLDVSSNWVVHLEPITAGLIATRSKQPGSGSVEVAFEAVGGWQAVLYNAPGDQGVSASLSTAIPVNSRDPAQPRFEVELGSEFALGPTRHTLALSQQTESVYFNRYGYTYLTYVYRQLAARAAIQLSSTQTVTVGYDGSWSLDTTTSTPVTYLAYHTGTLLWNWSEGQVSVFDPAHLGQPGFWTYAETRILVPETTDDRYYNPNRILTKSAPIYQFFGGAGLSTQVFDSRLALSGSVDGLALLGGIDDTRFFPWAFRTMGGNNWFSGYPLGYADFHELAVGSLSVRTNPLVDKFSRTYWFERLRLGAAIAGGVGRYFSSTESVAQGLRTGWPLSAEVSARASFYDAVDHQSTVILRFAMALNDFVASDGGTKLNLPFQVYGSYEY